MWPAELWTWYEGQDAAEKRLILLGLDITERGETEEMRAEKDMMVKRLLSRINDTRKELGMPDLRGTHSATQESTNLEMEDHWGAAQEAANDLEREL